MPMPPVIHLAAGASGTSASMRPYLDGLRHRGVSASFIALPRGEAERALPAYRAAVPPGDEAIIGGQSFGGRVASLLAAEEPYRGLVLLCYPLHPPGRPERAAARIAHWPRIGCPVLLLSGDRDPFAPIGALRSAVEQLPHAELIVFPGMGHGLTRVAEAVVDRMTDWAERLATLTA